MAIVAYQQAAEAVRHPLWKENCTKLPDEDFIVAVIIRCFSKVDSGRDFVQYYEQVYDVKICRSNWFAACTSQRRANMMNAVSPFICALIKDKRPL